MSSTPRLRLFKVMKKGEPTFFSRKDSAKAERNAQNKNGGSAVVMRGPDHWRGESFNQPSRRIGKRRAS